MRRPTPRTPRDDDERGPADPFEGMFRADGTLDADVVGRRLPSLVDLLRHDERCFDLRVDFDALARLLVGDAGAALRDAPSEDAFEDALRDFSREELAGLVPERDVDAAAGALRSIADDAETPRSRRRAAAAGVALASSLAGEDGLRGRGLFDLVLRVSLEELHAQEALRRRAAEEGALEAGELEEFWRTYPALRAHYERRYRRDVQQVLEALEADVLPQAVSIDLALRGANALLRTAALRREEGRPLTGDEARDVLGRTFEDDFLDGGRELVLARWTAACDAARRAGADDAASRRTVEATALAVRLGAPGSPGGELILFHAYMRAIVEGSFHVRDEAEAQVARGLFADSGLSADGVLAYAQHLGVRGESDDRERVLVAGIELWPQHEGLRAAAIAAAAERDDAARGERQGPTYDDAGETFSELDEDDADADDSPAV